MGDQSTAAYPHVGADGAEPAVVSRSPHVGVFVQSSGSSDP